MPIGPYTDFDACVLAMKEKGKTDEEARAICGKMEKDAEMADFNSAWIEIFRAGDYGDKGEWTEGDIDKVVSNFAAGTWKPPAVIGHPQTDSPAMGWVEGLRRENKTLLAKFGQVQPELEALVSNGRFPNRSAAFYTDPQGKGPILRHVGFLGATPPEVKGLAPVKFSSTQFTEINLEENPMSLMDEQKKTIREAIKDFFSELFGSKPAAGTFSEEQVMGMITKAVTAATTPLIDQNKQLATQFTELNNKLAASNTDTKRAQAVAFVEKLKLAGKWIPAFTAAGMEAMLVNLATSGGSVKFGETGKEIEITSYEAMCKFLEGLPAIVPAGDISGRFKTAGGKMIPFNEAKGISLDMDSVVLNEKAQKIATEQKIDLGEALRIAAGEMGV